MTHRNVQNGLLLYLDGELAESARRDIEQHLTQCDKCQTYLASLKSVWLTPSPHIVETPPHLWLQVASRLQESKNASPMWESLMGRKPWLIPSSLMAATLIVGILIGAYLGNLSDPTATAQAPVVAAEADSVLNAAYVDSFKDIPAGSVGSVYLAGLGD